MSFSIARPKSPARVGTPLPKLTTSRATTLATRPFLVGSVFGAGTRRITASSSRLTTIFARVPKTAAFAAA